MDIIYLLVPLAVALAGLIVWALMWAVKSGQFDDLEGPAHQILMEKDDVVIEADADRKDNIRKNKNKKNPGDASGPP